MSRPRNPDPGDEARREAIHTADISLNRAVMSKRALLADGSLTPIGYCAECWKIIAVRKGAARRIERDHPVNVKEATV